MAELGVEPCRADVERAAEAVLGGEPFGVVAAGEVADDIADLVDGLEDAAVDDLLLQGSEQAFDDAVGLRLGHEGEAWGDAPELDLVLEVVGHELGAVVLPQCKPAGDPGGEVAELLANGHGEGLGGFDPVARLGEVPAEELGVPMLGDAEDPDLAVPDRGDLGGVDGPHDVRHGGDDLALMWLLRSAAGTMGLEQLVLAHQAQDALGGDANAVARAQASPDFAMALAGPWERSRSRRIASSRGLVGDRGLRTTPCRR